MQTYIHLLFLHCKNTCWGHPNPWTTSYQCRLRVFVKRFCILQFVHRTCISLPEPLRFAAQLVIIKRERTFTEKRRKHHAYFGMDRKKQSYRSLSESDGGGARRCHLKKRTTPVSLQPLDALFGTNEESINGISEIAIGSLHPFQDVLCIDGKWNLPKSVWKE